ncbi:MAG: endonuclease/exonuclease/phosphatase family protein [Polyangiaceae bacterium]
MLQSAGIALFIAALLVAEHTRLTFLLLYAPRVPILLLAAAGVALALLTRHRVALLAGSQVAVFLAVLFPVMGFAVSVPRRAQHPLHLASYNVFFGKEGRPALIDEIVAMPADVLVIQAAFGSLGARLRERLPDRVIRQDGELILVSKFPVLSAEVPPDLAIAGTTAPMFVKYVIDTPDGALHVYNVHAFSPRHALFDPATRDNIAQRDGQIAAVVAAARSEPPPFVIAGDTNLPALSAIARRYFDGLTDAFAEVGFGFGYTFPAKRPWMRIDRFLGGAGVRFFDVRVAPRGASDHRAIFVDVDLASGG